MSEYHIPVLLQEILKYFQVKPGKIYIDGTLGGGSHSIEICKQGGKILGIDADTDALSYVKKRLIDEKSCKLGDHIIIANGNFRNIDILAKAYDFKNVDGILLDLGVSSHQIDEDTRGFSFSKDGPLDMRMDRKLAVSAKDLINGLTNGELHELFTKLGEERFARVISNNIIRARGIKPIVTTEELARLIEAAYGIRNRIATAREKAMVDSKVFQALRIAVNDELNALKEALPKSLSLLKPGGRMAVISFHSLEDRIIKEQFLLFEKNGYGKILTKRPIVPSHQEIRSNRRSRSAKLRVLEKI